MDLTDTVNRVGMLIFVSTGVLLVTYLVVGLMGYIEGHPRTDNFELSRKEKA